jgi:hypothetical protein
MLRCMICSSGNCVPASVVSVNCLSAVADAVERHHAHCSGASPTSRNGRYSVVKSPSPLKVLAMLQEHKGGVYDLKLRGAEARQPRSAARHNRTQSRSQRKRVCLFVRSTSGAPRGQGACCAGVLVLERLHGQVVGGRRLPVPATLRGTHELRARSLLLQPVRRRHPHIMHTLHAACNVPLSHKIHHVPVMQRTTVRAMCASATTAWHLRGDPALALPGECPRYLFATC